MNDTTEYNNIIPQYLDNDVNDFDLFPNESIAATNNTTEYFNGNGANLNYSITNLDSVGQTFIDGNGIISFDSPGDSDHIQLNQQNHERTTHSMITFHSNINQTSTFDTIRLSNTDGFIANGNLTGTTLSDTYPDHNDGSHFFPNKFLPMKSIDNSVMLGDQCMMLSDQCVSSEAIIDILDLTNDEVEQILDDNLINHEFDSLAYPNSCGNSDSNSFYGKYMEKNAISNSLICKKMATDGCIWLDSVEKIDLATSLTSEQTDGKSIEMRSLETPIINLDVITTTTTTNEETETPVVIKPIDDTPSLPITKKKSGRTRGARQKSM